AFRRRVAIHMTAGSALLAILAASTSLAQPGRRPFYRQHNLVSDGSVDADHTDSNLVNPWGIAPNPTGVWWVADNGTGVSTLYDASGAAQSLVVTIPNPAGDTDPAKPTGIVFNGTSDFVVSDGTHSGAAKFLF